MTFFTDFFKNRGMEGIINNMTDMTREVKKIADDLGVEYDTKTTTYGELFTKIHAKIAELKSETNHTR